MVASSLADQFLAVFGHELEVFESPNKEALGARVPPNELQRESGVPGGIARRPSATTAAWTHNGAGDQRLQPAGAKRTTG